MVGAKVGPQARFFSRERVDEIVLLLREAEKHILDLRQSGRIAIDSGERIIETLRTERDIAVAALVGLVGSSTRAELEQMEMAMRLMPAPAADKAATIDAIHALLSLKG